MFKNSLQLYIFFIEFLRFRVSNIIRCRINFFFPKKIGALTSKPFAYKAWPWELSISYITDISNFGANKLRVDFKGLEILWLLPWSDDIELENWITDKAWFSYDGFSLNRITKFFIRKKISFLPLFFFVLHLIDPLFIKYSYTKNYIETLNYYSIFINSKNNFFSFFFNFFQFFSTYFYYFIAYKEKFTFNNYNVFYKFLSKGWGTRIFMLTSLFDSPKILVKKFIKIFLQTRKNLNIGVQKKKIINKFNAFASLDLKNTYFLIFLNIFNHNYHKLLNFIPESSIDILNLMVLKKLALTSTWWDNKKKLFKSFSIDFPVKLNQLFFVKNNWFNFINNFKDFNKLNLIYLINVNLWITYPKFYLQIWKLAKSTEIIIISAGNVDELTFKHIDLGFWIETTQKILCAKHWLTNKFFRVEKTGFFINLENSNFINLEKLTSTSLKKFFSKTTKKSYFISSFLFYFVGETIYVNHKIINFFLRINNLKKINKISSNLYITTTMSNSKTNFLLKFTNFSFQIKKNFYIIIDSNIKNIKIFNFWDIILPLTIITENFLIYKNLENYISKSLFIKQGPWYARNLFSYLNILITTLTFPFFWLSNLSNLFTEINLLYFWFWLLGVIKNEIIINQNNLIDIKKFSWLVLIWKFFLIFEPQCFFISLIWNFWFTELSFLQNSRYNNMGFSLLNKEKKTFNI